MKRHDENLDQALKKLDQDVIWLPSRFEKNKEVLSSKLYQRSVHQVSRKTQRPRKKWIPIVVTIVFLGVFGTFMFNMILNDQPIAIDDVEEKDPTNASEGQDTDAEHQEDDQMSQEDMDQDITHQPLEDMFEKEKELEIMLEGMPETIQVELVTNDDWRYIMYVDQDRYVFNRGETADRIDLKEPIDADLPEIAMEIRRLNEDIEVEEAIELITKEVHDAGLEVDRQEDVTWPFTALSIVALGEERTEHGKFGHQWDTPVHKYYVTEGEGGELFVIKQMYFIEAEEGHGARFDQQLETFQIVP